MVIITPSFTLDKTDHVTILTEPEILEFNRTNGMWFNGIKEEWVDDEQFIELLRGYELAGCVVIPVRDKPDYTAEVEALPSIDSIDVPDNACYLRCFGVDAQGEAIDWLWEKLDNDVWYNRANLHMTDWQLGQWMYERAQEYEAFTVGFFDEYDDLIRFRRNKEREEVHNIEKVDDN